MVDMKEYENNKQGAAEVAALDADAGGIYDSTLTATTGLRVSQLV